MQGASRGIGLALVRELRARHPDGRVYASCRDPDSATELAGLADQDPAVRPVRLDVSDVGSIAAAAGDVAASTDALDLVINCAGILHEADGPRPERRLSELEPESLRRVLDVNATGPMLVAREFERLLRGGREPLFAALSARVGSIGDNRLGGWYAYRMSKAALNMGLKTLAIEWGRGARPITVAALHPGTVATDLSAPFRPGGTDEAGVFPPRRAARQLLDVLSGVGPRDSGGFFAWDGRRIPW